MSRLQGRLEKLEKAMIPSGRIAMVFVRPEHKEDDCAKQKEEYFARWRHWRDPTFLIMTMYSDIDDDYETFIQNRRTSCPPVNCFTDWWERKEKRCV